MSKSRSLLCMLSLLCSAVFLTAEDSPVDFDESMRTTNYPQIKSTTTDSIGIDGNLLYHSLKGLYNKNNLSHRAPGQKLKIPKIIHQIIIGNLITEHEQSCMNSWASYELDGWSYKLWTDTELSHLDMYTKQYFNETTDPTVKSILAAYEILYRYGGVYISPHLTSVKPLDILHYAYDFYAGLEPLESQSFQIGTGLIGSRAAHPVLKAALETVVFDWQETDPAKKIGSIHLTKAFYLMSDLFGLIDIALPADYFYAKNCNPCSFAIC